MEHVGLPSRDPGASLESLRHIKADEFRFVRNDGPLGSAMTFKRNVEGKMIAHEHEWHVAGRLRALPHGNH